MPAMIRPSDSDKARAFFALWPATGEAGQLAAWQRLLLPLCGGRAMRAGTLHSTLLFVGDIERPRLEALWLAAEEAGRRVDGAAFELCFDAVRYWQHNRIVYAAPGDVPPRLERLVTELGRSLDRQGFSFDRRAYQPHVTLLRNARLPGVPLPALPPVCWQIVDFVLAESAGRGGQADYRVLARFPPGPG